MAEGFDCQGPPLTWEGFCRCLAGQHGGRVTMVHNHRSGGLGWRGVGGVAWGS